MKKLIVAAVAFLSLLCIAPLTVVDGEAAAKETTFQTQFSIDDTYALGETVDFPTAIYGDKTECRASLLYQSENGIRVEKTVSYGVGLTHTFDKTVEWYVVFEAITEEGVVPISYDFSVVEKDYIEIEKTENTIKFGTQGKTPSAWYIERDGDKYECTVSLQTPNGTVFTPKQSEEYNQIGEYIYTFSYQKDGVSIEKEKRIQCALSYDALFYANGENFFSATANSSAPAYSQETKGVLIEGTFGDTVYYRNIIDLTALDSETSVLEFQVINDSKMKTIQVNLIDAYDPNNVVTLTWTDTKESESYTRKWSYMRAGTDGLSYGRKASGGYYDSEKFGALVVGSFQGALGAEAYKQPLPMFNFQFDIAKKSIYTKTVEGAVGKSSLVVDMSDPITGINWEGFTTGEVYLSFTFPSSSTAPAVLVTNIGGCSLGDTADVVGPSLRVPIQNTYGYTLPNALVGTAYPIPEAYANDVLVGAVGVTKKVYFGNQEGEGKST